MKKTIRPCTVKIGNFQRKVFITIEYKDGSLSLSGVIGPRANGNCYGSCGQIDMEFRPPADTQSKWYEDQLKWHKKFMQSIVYADGWNQAKFQKLLEVWQRWHLNDFHAECEHQRELGWIYEEHHGVWEEKPFKQPQYLIDEYATGENEIQWVWNEYRGHACPVCGYEIGSARLKEEVPSEVINWLFSLPNADVPNPWND